MSIRFVKSTDWSWTFVCSLHPKSPFLKVLCTSSVLRTSSLEILSWKLDFKYFIVSPREPTLLFISICTTMMTNCRDLCFWDNWMDDIDCQNCFRNIWVNIMWSVLWMQLALHVIGFIKCWRMEKGLWTTVMYNDWYSRRILVGNDASWDAVTRMCGLPSVLSLNSHEWQVVLRSVISRVWL